MNKQTLLEVAIGQYGVTEIKGRKHNPVIVSYSHTVGFDGVVDDETAWCSIFINWCAKIAGKERTGKMTARSWLNVGEDSLNPKPGDVVVLWRESPDSWKGHVGLFIGYSDDCEHVYLLGGNQNNSVCIKKYPSDRILNIKRLRNAQ